MRIVLTSMKLFGILLVLVRHLLIFWSEIKVCSTHCTEGIRSSGRMHDRLSLASLKTFIYGRCAWNKQLSVSISGQFFFPYKNYSVLFPVSLNSVEKINV